MRVFFKVFLSESNFLSCQFLFLKLRSQDGIIILGLYFKKTSIEKFWNNHYGSYGLQRYKTGFVKLCCCKNSQILACGCQWETKSPNLYAWTLRKYICQKGIAFCKLVLRSIDFLVCFGAKSCFCLHKIIVHVILYLIL